MRTPEYHKMSEKSSFTPTVVDATGARISAPRGLNSEENCEWEKIVNSLPASYFRPGDIPLLEAFVSAAALWRQAKALIRSEGLMLFDGKRKYVNPAQAVMVNQAGAMAQMAVKLRLCPSARYSEKKAETQAGRASASGDRKPWEMTGTEDD
jgi:P27 family predicted phage terminase small subunit